jgi:UDP-GlcNAc:undecaprenyl-phosphate/decaprenyl-phosphate GlcNAc-1-phosphate transferase
VALGSFFEFLFVFSLAFLVTYATVPAIIPLAIKLGLMDRPGDRRIHSTPIPRCGGFALLLGVITTFATVAYLNPVPERTLFMQAVLMGAMLIWLVGFLDDLLSLSWSVKFIGQVLVASFFYWSAGGIGEVVGIVLPRSLDAMLSIGLIVGVVNAFNLIDGLDGLASGLAAIAGGALIAVGLLQGRLVEAMLLAGVCGSTLGFLRYNFHPARIFLGDSGSMLLGFLLVVIGLHVGSRNSALAAIVVPLLAVGVPLFDTMLAVWRRSVRGYSQTGQLFSSNLTKPDSDHLHHRLLKSGLSQRKVAFVLYAFNLFLVSVAMLSLLFASHAIGIAVLAILAGGYVVIGHLARVELWDSGQMILRGLRRPSRGLLAAATYPLFDGLILLVTTALAAFLARPHLSLTNYISFYRASLPIWGAAPFLAVFLGGVYSKVWSRARVSDFVFLTVFLGAGCAIAAVITGLTSRQNGAEVAAFAMLQFLSSGFLFNLLRALPRAIQDLIGGLEQEFAYYRRCSSRVIVYGAGDRGILYLKMRVMKQGRTGAFSGTVVGFIDDEDALRKRKVHGYSVLGTWQNLREVVIQRNVTDIVITATLDSVRLDHVLQLAKERGLTVKKWVFEERIVLEPRGFDDLTQAAA